MTTLAIPNSIANAQALDATPVDQNFDEIQSHVNTELINRDGTVAMTGQLSLGAGDPVADGDAARKAYVDGKKAVNDAARTSGGTTISGTTVGGATTVAAPSVTLAAAGVVLVALNGTFTTSAFTAGVPETGDSVDLKFTINGADIATVANGLHYDVTANGQTSVYAIIPLSVAAGATTVTVGAYKALGGSASATISIDTTFGVGLFGALV
jgi:hypothetical protein